MVSGSTHSSAATWCLSSGIACRSFGHRELVVGVRGDSQRRRGAAEDVPDAAVVLRAADEDADGFVMVGTAKDIIDKGDVEVEFDGVFGLELAYLQFDNDVADCSMWKKSRST